MRIWPIFPAIILMSWRCFWSVVVFIMKRRHYNYPGRQMRNRRTELSINQNQARPNRDGGRRESRNFFFNRDVAPRRASNQGPFYENYGDKYLGNNSPRETDDFTQTLDKYEIKAWICQKMNLTNLSNLMSKVKLNVAWKCFLLSLF